MSNSRNPWVAGTVQMKLKVALMVCALIVVACSANDEQSELVTVQAATPTTAALPTTSASATAVEVVGPPDILTDSLMDACGFEAVSADIIDAYTTSSVIINSALGVDDPLVIEYYAALETTRYVIPTEAEMARIYAAIDALAADERTADADWNAVKSAFAAVEELIDCMVRLEPALTTTVPESAEGISTDASLYTHEALCRAAGYEWTNPDAATGTFCTE